MRRVTDAILAGDYMTAMAEATPDALLQAMQLGGGVMNLPPPDRYEITPLAVSGAEHRLLVRFYAGVQSLSATVILQDVEGAWKITGISDLEASES